MRAAILAALTFGLAASAATISGGQLKRLNGPIGQPHVSSTGTKYVVSTPETNPLGGSLRYVKDSGVCETTPGVAQASGYADLTSKMSMWFWVRLMLIISVSGCLWFTISSLRLARILRLLR
jgi:hypothetical protein